MKTVLRFLPLLLHLFFAQQSFAQTQEEIEQAKREAEESMRQMEGQLTPEQKKMMQEMGVQFPVAAMNAESSGVDSGEMGVPSRDEARISAIPSKVNSATMGAYIVDVTAGFAGILSSETIAEGETIFSQIQARGSNAEEYGTMAMGFWMGGEPELALILMGKSLKEDPAQPDNLNNFAAMLSMQGGQHLAIPILEMLDKQFPNNSTILNNLGQAWLGLGEIPKAEKYLDGALALYAFHPQANQSKCYIEHSKGNEEKAAEHLEKSLEHSYTEEKATQLRQLGKKSTYKSYRLPKRGKGDGLNLGSFKAPAFPQSVEECVTLGSEWVDFLRQIDAEIEQLEARKADLEETANKGQEERMSQDLAMIQAGRSDPTSYGGEDFVSMPLYADRANKVFAYVSDEHVRKLERYIQRYVAKVGGELQDLKSGYEAKMDKLRKEEDEQLGDGRANESFCTKYKAASDDFLKAANPILEEFYKEYLELQKPYLNEVAYWSLYTYWSDHYEVIKIGLKIEWLKALKEGAGNMVGNSEFPFYSITEYNCDGVQDDGKQVKLANFDDVHCEYKSHIDYYYAVIDTNCSSTTTTYNLGETTIIERELGGKFIGSTVKTSSKIEAGGQVGPLKVEGSIGADVTIEKDENGNVKDWESTVTGALESGVGVSKGPVKAGATITSAIEVEIGKKGLRDVNMITKLEGKAGVGPVSVSAGIQDKVSLISGHGAVTGTGKLSGMIFSEW